jgi:hypothetical protein
MSDLGSVTAGQPQFLTRFPSSNSSKYQEVIMLAHKATHCRGLPKVNPMHLQNVRLQSNIPSCDSDGKASVAYPSNKAESAN